MGAAISDVLLDNPFTGPLITVSDFFLPINVIIFFILLFLFLGYLTFYYLIGKDSSKQQAQKDMVWLLWLLGILAGVYFIIIMINIIIVVGFAKIARTGNFGVKNPEVGILNGFMTPFEKIIKYTRYLVLFMFVVLLIIMISFLILYFIHDFSAVQKTKTPTDLFETVKSLMIGTFVTLGFYIALEFSYRIYLYVITGHFFNPRRKHHADNRLPVI